MPDTKYIFPFEDNTSLSLSLNKKTKELVREILPSFLEDGETTISGNEFLTRVVKLANPNALKDLEIQSKQLEEAKKQLATAKNFLNSTKQENEKLQITNSELEKGKAILIGNAGAGEEAIKLAELIAKKASSKHQILLPEFRKIKGERNLLSNENEVLQQNLITLQGTSETNQTANQTLLSEKQELQEENQLLLKEVNILNLSDTELKRFKDFLKKENIVYGVLAPHYTFLLKKLKTLKKQTTNFSALMRLFLDIQKGNYEQIFINNADRKIFEQLKKKHNEPK